MIEYYLMGIILIPGLILAAWAQNMVQNNFKDYGMVLTKIGKTASAVAKELLIKNNINDVEVIKQSSGYLSDHYDSRKKIIALSPSVYDSTSIAALGIAAHETGHAIQHHKKYFPLIVRNIIIPVSNLLSQLLWPLLIVGIILDLLILTKIGSIFIWCGIISFGLAVLINLITLPVEFNASKRAINNLSDGYLEEEEIEGAKKVLKSAALTYIAALVMSILNFLRYIFVILLNSKRE